MTNNNQNFNDLFRLIDIYQVINSKVKLTKKGANFWGICPFHNDENPSMSVSTTKGIFKCFSCNASGNAITFLEKLDHLNFMQALTMQNAFSATSVTQHAHIKLLKWFRQLATNAL